MFTSEVTQVARRNRVDMQPYPKIKLNGTHAFNDGHLELTVEEADELVLCLQTAIRIARRGLS